MAYTFKIEVATSGIYEVGDNGDFDQETEEVEVSIERKDFVSNLNVKQLYVEEFKEKYNIKRGKVEEILDDYDIWFEDEELVENILTYYTDKLEYWFPREVKYATRSL